ncbi:alpha/beta hydrolase [Mucilaginibacter sp. AW1-3]
MKIKNLFAIIITVLATSYQLYAQTDTLWKGFKRTDFIVAERKCIVVSPQTPAPGRPWIWRTEFFGNEPHADSALLTKGYYLVYMNMQDMYGAPMAMGLMDQFYAYLIKNYKLNKKTVLEGFSRGGLFAFNWAVLHPDKVATIYGDAPVCDFKSWPGGKGRGPGSAKDWQKLLKVYGFTEEEALAYKLNPVDNLAPLARAHIPVIIVCGGADSLLPVEENTFVVEKRYQELGGEIKVIVKPGGDHHPHSLKDPAPIVDFILSHQAAK